VYKIRDSVAITETYMCTVYEYIILLYDISIFVGKYDMVLTRN
jgi:hypothetical protein